MYRNWLLWPSTFQQNTTNISTYNHKSFWNFEFSWNSLFSHNLINFAEFLHVCEVSGFSILLDSNIFQKKHGIFVSIRRNCRQKLYFQRFVYFWIHVGFSWKVNCARGKILKFSRRFTVFSWDLWRRTREQIIGWGEVPKSVVSKAKKTPSLNDPWMAEHGWQRYGGFQSPVGITGNYPAVCNVRPGICQFVP